MANHIIHIHGLRPKPAQSVLGERELRYLSEGTGTAIPPANFHLVYWSDLMGYYPETATEYEYKEESNNFREYSSKEQITLWIQGKTRAAIKDTLEDLLQRYLQSSESERSKAEQKVLNHLLSLISSKSAELIYRHFLQDLHRYFFGGKRDAVLNRLREQIDEIPDAEPVSLIAHSMGSIIAFDLLLQGTRHQKDRGSHR